MKTHLLVSFGALVANVFAQDAFEPSDFNVTEALVANGVDVSAIPQLANLTEKRSLFNPCATACSSLKLIFGNKVLTSGSDYDAFTGGYWSTQAASVNPTCVFKPEKALEVSTLVLLSRLTQCPFAIKGGGHTAFPGASSIEDGITISLESMDEITLSSDKKTAFIGPGNRWGAIYSKLAEHDLAVIGGRASDVGLGLVLGGGVAHQSNIYGFACDNVASYTLVTASGIILKITPTQFPDLFWALRGGGNNFGIVTRFELETIPQAKLIWGGTRVHMPSDYPKLIDAFANLVEGATEDPKAVQILSFAVTAGNAAAQLQLEYLEPVDEVNPPAILKEYLSIPAIKVDTINRTLADDTEMLTAQMPGGHRYAFWAGTWKLDRDFMAWMQAKHQKELGPLPDQGSLTFQGFAVPALSKMSKNGGNALGLSLEDGPLMHTLLYMVWDDASRDDEFNKAALDFMNAAKEEAKKRDVYSRYIYLNYAGPYQNVIPSYGEANLAKLKAISKKYDPMAVFHKLQPGGYKLEGAPYGETI